MEQQEGARLQTRDGKDVALQGITLTGELRGLLFEAQVKQDFVNPGKRPIEVVYRFPLPWGAVLLGVDVVLGERHLKGVVVEKKQAEQRYEEALSDGHAAIMLEQNRDHSYSLNLGNLAAGEHCSITLRYAQTLAFAQRGLRLLIPTVIAPRYGDAQRDGGLQPHQTPRHSSTAEYPFDLTLRLHGPLARARVASPSHPVAFTHEASEHGGVLNISLARHAVLDRDFVLVIDQLAQDAVASAALDAVHPQQVAVLAGFCPRIPARDGSPMTVKILVDCSGSMAGDSMQAARRALHAIIGQFGAEDRFALSRFGSTVEHRSRSLWKVTEATRLAALRWVGELEANLGGTEMQGALDSTFALGHSGRGDGHGDGNDTSDVLLITDGEIEAIDRTIESAQQSAHRLFIVGIGSSPAEAHLRRLADATGGACDFVAPGEDVEPAVLRMFARLRSPRLADLRLLWPAGVSPRWVSNLPTSVFDGDTVRVFALLPEAAEGEVRLVGKSAATAPEQDIASICLTREVGEGDALARMAAAAHLRQPGTPTKSGLRLALDYQLVTPLTNFLLVHERADGERAGDMPELHAIAPMVPAGWGGMGSVSSSFEIAAPALRCSIGVPGVWRTKRAPATQHSAISDMGMDGSDDLAIPAFLRKGRQAADIDHDDPRLWSDTEHYAGLTPLGVAEWLHLTPRNEWPTTYEGLRAMGLGAWVIDWLQWRVAVSGGMQHSEEAVVAAFVHLMAWHAHRMSPIQGLRAALQTMVQHLRKTPAGIDMTLVDAMAADLQDMTAQRWPDAVLSLDAQGSGAPAGDAGLKEPS